jgi:hypothetical protein
LANEKQMHLIVVDDSPPEIHAKLWQEQGDYVKMFRQDKEQFQGKGGALRQAIYLAKTRLEPMGSSCAICFTEPEKVDLMNHVNDIVQPLLVDAADVVVPFRNPKLFQDTYPIEQYHSESFANLHFDSLAKQHDGFKAVERLDWLFGPFAFKVSLANQWLQYTGKSWDAQMIPYVRGIRSDMWRVQSVEVNFEHPSEMKEQEEGNPVWTNKRLHQLNILFDLLGKTF